MGEETKGERAGQGEVLRPGEGLRPAEDLRPSEDSGHAEALGQGEYERLAAFRFALRRFLQFSAQAAQHAGLTPTQHQALLSIKGHPGQGLITIGQLADHLLVAPHTAAELVSRLEDDGMVRKVVDANDRRRVGLELTAKAAGTIHRLSSIHLQEVRVMAPGLIETLEGLLPRRAEARRRVAGRR